GSLRARPVPSAPRVDPLPRALGPALGGGVCPAPAPRDRALRHRPRAPRELPRARGALLPGAAPEVRGRYLRALPGLRGPRGRLSALPLRRVWPRRARGLLLQTPWPVPELWGAQDVQ